MITKEREDYLKTIYHLQKEETPVRTNSIAKALKLEPASVTGAIKRLAELGYVVYSPYKGVELSDSGERVALDVIRNHRLIELFLIEKLGYSWDEVHDEAERLEHAASHLFVERIAIALGDPARDPHGSPIPTRDGHIAERNEVSLQELPVGYSGVITRVSDEDAELLRYLAELGLWPGVGIKMVELAPYGGPIHVVIGNISLAVGLEAARQVYISPTGDQV